jgi:hypothetical protein
MSRRLPLLVVLLGLRSGWSRVGDVDSFEVLHLRRTAGGRLHAFDLSRSGLGHKRGGPPVRSWLWPC